MSEEHWCLKQCTVGAAHATGNRGVNGLIQLHKIKMQYIELENKQKHSQYVEL